MKILKTLLLSVFFNAVLFAQADVEVIVNIDDTKHEASSYIIGTQRNLVQENTGWWENEFGVPNAANNLLPETYSQMIQEYADLEPRFGEGKKIFRLQGATVDGTYQKTKPCDSDPALHLFPFDATGYHFQDHFGSVGPYPYDDIEYFHSEAETLKSDMIVSVNVGTGTPTEAADLVQYFKNEELLDQVAFFEMGNELGGTWQIGSHISDNLFCSPQDYADYVKPFIDAMKAVDSTIKISACGAYNNSWEWEHCDDIVNENCVNPPIPEYSYAEVITAIINTLGDRVDYISYHGYTMYKVILKDADSCKINGVKEQVDTDYRAPLILATADYAKENFHIPAQNLIDQLRSDNEISKEIHLVNTEFSTEISQPLNFRHTITQAIYTADHMLTAFQEDHRAAVNFCLYHFQFPDADDIEDNLFFSLDGTFKKPIFYVHKLVAENMGTTVLEHETVNTVFTDGLMTCHEEESIEYEKIDLVSTKDPDGTVRTLIINRSTEDLTLDLDIVGGGDYTNNTMKTVAGDDYLDAEAEIVSGMVADLSNISVPKLSVNVLISSPCSTSGSNTEEGCGITVEISGLDITLIASDRVENTIVTVSPPWNGSNVICNDWTGMFCDAGATTSVSTPGTYTIVVQGVDPIHPEYCTFEVVVDGSEGGVVDNDEDGVPCSEDCDDNDPTVGYPQEPGTECDDENPNTNDDQIQADGCTCEGTTSCPTQTTTDCNVTLNFTGLNVSFVSDDLNNSGVLIIQLYLVGANGWEGPYLLCNSWNPATSCVQDANIDLPTAGQYAVVVQGNGECNTFFVPVTECTDGSSGEGEGARNNGEEIQKMGLNPEMLVYPNPTKDEFNILFGYEARGMLTIFNTAGKKVFSLKIDDENRTQPVSIQGLETGVYFVEFNNQKRSFQQKVVVVE